MTPRLRSTAPRSTAPVPSDHYKPLASCNPTTNYHHQVSQLNVTNQPHEPIKNHFCSQKLPWITCWWDGRRSCLLLRRSPLHVVSNQLSILGRQYAGRTLQSRLARSLKRMLTSDWPIYFLHSKKLNTRKTERMPLESPHVPLLFGMQIYANPCTTRHWPQLTRRKCSKYHIFRVFYPSSVLPPAEKHSEIFLINMQMQAIRFACWIELISATPSACTVITNYRQASDGRLKPWILSESLLPQGGIPINTSIRTEMYCSRIAIWMYPLSVPKGYQLTILTFLYLSILIVSSYSQLHQDQCHGIITH